MKTKIKLLSVLQFSILISLYLNGCSLVGMAIGSSEDERIPDSIVVYQSQFKDVDLNDKISIELKSGEYYRGSFLGVKRYSFIDYAWNYNIFIVRLKTEKRLPAIEEPLYIQTIEKKKRQGKFLGFNRERIFLEGENYTYDSYSLNNIVEITDAIGNSYDMEKIRELISSHNFPTFPEEKNILIPEVKINYNSGNMYFPITEIKQFIYIPQKNGLIKGLFIGLGIDIAVFLTLLLSSGGMNISI